jgi:hypothetical protein
VSQRGHCAPGRRKGHAQAQIPADRDQRAVPSVLGESVEADAVDYDVRAEPRRLRRLGDRNLGGALETRRRDEVDRKRVEESALRRSHPDLDNCLAGAVFVAACRQLLRIGAFELKSLVASEG